jgi:hypothetical protein
MSQCEKEWVVSFRVVPVMVEVPPLRVLLRETLEGAGFRLSRGVTTQESWMVDELARPPAPFVNSHYVPEAEHIGRVRHRTRGAGPQS